MNDDELIAALAAGDETALRELFTRHAPWLAARLRAALPAADVEDALQETFLAVWRGAVSYRPQGTPQAWMWVIARNQAALLLRRRCPALTGRCCGSCMSRTVPSPRLPPCSGSPRAQSRAAPTGLAVCCEPHWEEHDDVPVRAGEDPE
jgi:DNA-directed RNA polymerase specialized sigma24 family protein